MELTKNVSYKLNFLTFYKSAPVRNRVNY